jgi:hypothetical protein
LLLLLLVIYLVLLLMIVEPVERILRMAFAVTKQHVATLSQPLKLT